MARLLRRAAVLRAANSGQGAVSIAGPLTITPTLSDEVLTNGDFSAWTGDNPDGWTVVGESGSDPMVTQVAPGGGAGTGAARLFSSATNFQPRLSQSGYTTNNWYQFSLFIDTVVSGTLTLTDSIVQIAAGINTIGTKFYCRQWKGTLIQVRGQVGPTDVSVDDVSSRLITLATTFYTLSDAFVPRVIRAETTRTANTQAGVAHYADENNLVLAYLDGSGNVVLLKRVGGMYTQVAAAAIAYSAGAVLELDYDPSAETYTVLYNTATAISAQSVTDAVFVTATGSRLFSTYDNNSFENIYASAVP
jgi:hypothetical protein